mmetsp:Transcript_56532/g.157556  ORF Transcript_56532/g.157556 Transcript_56532/m.157556 type:complete len:532 (-) Transcript_56532:140-1735(-)|eukprot:CAMPEP_0117501670 /NCGR_PEP_ID=MMETSP0784-20121206/23418_1 /TAXON_ID=39447 /ORGANISM="" /LENGTH=531 /DNA_ID=CAMNT_0005296931 /DNA_START=42 /DNA_END=1637 /DNA_ORIENTATION=-
MAGVDEGRAAPLVGSHLEPPSGCLEVGSNVGSSAVVESLEFAAKRPSKTNFVKVAFCVVALVAFLTIYWVPVALDDAEQKCLAVLAFVCILWASEAIPLWVTSLCIPMLIVTCNIILTPKGDKLSAPDSAVRELAKIADPNVILLMGGFTIAAALHKFGIDVRIASRIQGAVGGGAPKLFILANMMVGFVLSMFCNNVAAPVVTFFLVSPVLHRVEDRQYCKCMVMAIAFACNIGGMPTPIASPQNAQALKEINDVLHDDVTFLSWMAFALPVCLVLLPICWAWLIFWWRPTLRAIPPPPSSLAFERQVTPGSAFVDAPWEWRHTYVMAVSGGTILLWCIFDVVKAFFGNMGVVGLIPVIMLYGPGILEKEDFKRMDWGILMLLGGGAALGDAVQSSGLLGTLGDSLLHFFQEAEFSVYAQFMFFNVVIIFVSNFISHTVAAITMLGVLGKVGHSVQKGRAFVLGGVICDSGACGLPVSSFPNVLAYGVKDANGEAYLKVTDYFVPAIVLEIVCLILMATVGWAMADLVRH